MPLSTPLTGPLLAQALLAGPLTDLRIQKAARHVLLNHDLAGFLAALPDEQRSEIEPKIRQWLHD